MNDRTRNRIIVVVIIVALGLIVWFSASARSDASSARDSSDRATAATADIAAVLNRRSPILEYLSCSDARDQAVDTAEKAFLLALVDKAPEVTQLRHIYELAVENRAKTNMPTADGGCGGIPTGG